MEASIIHNCQNRVKSLSFHACYPILAVALNSGEIELWNWEINTVLVTLLNGDTLDEATVVRCAVFHSTKDLLVCGSDDFLVRIWNVNIKSATEVHGNFAFALSGHTDYIRSVQFHPASNWLLSASDDRSLRIWDCELQSCLYVVLRHNHFVMSAVFHCRYNLIVSGSFDGTVRVWPLLARVNDALSPTIPNYVGYFLDDYVVEVFAFQHYGIGVHSVAFHPFLPLVVSGVYNCVMMYQLARSEFRLIAKLRGHTRYVSAVMFHPTYELVVSASTDGTVQLWNMRTKEPLQRFQSDVDLSNDAVGRFWCVAMQSVGNGLVENYFAAGRDEGLVMFSLTGVSDSSTVLTRYSSSSSLSDFVSMEDVVVQGVSLLENHETRDSCLEVLSSLQSAWEFSKRRPVRPFHPLKILVSFVVLWSITLTCQALLDGDIRPGFIGFLIFNTAISGDRFRQWWTLRPKHLYPKHNNQYVGIMWAVILLLSLVGSIFLVCTYTLNVIIIISVIIGGITFALLCGGIGYYQAIWRERRADEIIIQAEKEEKSDVECNETIQVISL